MDTFLTRLETFLSNHQTKTLKLEKVDCLKGFDGESFEIFFLYKQKKEPIRIWVNIQPFFSIYAHLKTYSVSLYRKIESITEELENFFLSDPKFRFAFLLDDKKPSRFNIQNTNDVFLESDVFHSLLGFIGFYLVFLNLFSFFDLLNILSTTSILLIYFFLFIVTVSFTFWLFYDDFDHSQFSTYPFVLFFPFIIIHLLCLFVPFIVNFTLSVFLITPILSILFRIHFYQYHTKKTRQ